MSETELLDGQWQRGHWRSWVRWRCVHCQWDTLAGIAAAREYAANCPRCHPAPPEIQPSPILVADKRGKVKEDRNE